MSLICIFAYVCVFFVPVIDCTFVLCRRGWAASHAVAAELIQFAGHAESPVLFAGRWLEVFQTRARFYDTFTSDFVEWRSAVLWVLERCRARSSCSVCCEGSLGDSRWEWEWVTEWYDWRSLGASPLSRSTVFFATPWHRCELSDERYSDHIQFKYWLLRQLTPGTTDRSPPVYYGIATTRLLLCACCLSLATSFWWHSRLYTVIDSFSCLPVSIFP